MHKYTNNHAYMFNGNTFLKSNYFKHRKLHHGVGEKKNENMIEGSSLQSC